MTIADVDRAAGRTHDVLLGDGVVLIPTDTFYGLAGNPYSRVAVDRIMVLKNRPPTLPLPVLVGTWHQVEQLAEVPERYRADLEASWPGALTAVLVSRHSLPAAPGSTVAIRIPGHPLLRALLARVGPVTGTSANRHGMHPAVIADEALRSLNGAPDLVIDGGRTEGGGPSTVVSLTGSRARLLRSGKHDAIVGRFC